MNLKKLLASVLSVTLLTSMIPTVIFAAEQGSEKQKETVTGFRTLYENIGASIDVDTVTSATNFTSFHAKDIQPLIHKVTDEVGNVILDGVVESNSGLTPVSGTGSYQYTSKYGIGEFIINPENVVWNDYYDSIYAVTISNGDKTVGTLPWVDYYGEHATSGPHFNKLEIALNNGKSIGSNKADVARFSDFMSKNTLIGGDYMVTVYSTEYAPLKVSIPVKSVATEASVSVDSTESIDGETRFTVNNLPADFEATYSTNIEQSTAVYSDGGKITFPVNTTPGNYTLTVSDTSGKYADITASFTVSAYLVMNIPYAQFYKAEVRNDVDVDVFTSATKKKTLSSGIGLAGGTYHKPDGSEVSGVTYFVHTSKLPSIAKLVDAADISSSSDYSYYFVDAKPDNYKELTVTGGGRQPETISLDKVTGKAIKEISDADVKLLTASRYGDYQINISGLRNTIDREGNVTKEGAISNNAVIYGAIISTDENDYGMRALENIWRDEISWCVGITEIVHNCPTSSAHYMSIAGQTIKGITYYTSEGIYKFKTDIYVPIKSSDITASVENVYVSGGKVKVNATLPKNFDAEYSVNITDAVIEADTIKFPTTTAPGKYTLTVTDKKGLYAPLSASFEVVADTIPAKYDETKGALVANGNQEAFEAYINAITSVSVDGVLYNKMGMRGQAGVTIVKDDGTIDTSLELFNNPREYEIKIAIAGYDEFTLKIDLRSVQNITVTDTYTKTCTDKSFDLDAKADGPLSYSSSNTKVVTVDAKGKITIMGAGTAIITVNAAATETYKPASKIVKINVEKNTSALGLEVKKETLTYNESEAQTTQLVVTGNKGKVTYNSVSKYVTVSADGVVTVKKAAPVGTYKITAVDVGNSNYKEASANVSIKIVKAKNQAKATISKSTVTYNNKKNQKIAITVKNAKGKVTYSSASKYVTVSADGVVTVKKAAPVGIYKITVKISGNSNYKEASTSVSFKIVKANNPAKVTISKSTVTYNNKKDQKIAITVKNAKGKVTYKSAKKNVIVSSKGIVTIKKGTKKGTYKITVKVAGNNTYKADTKTISIKVK